MYKGIIFDLDGTLSSTNELIYASFNHITEKYLGKTITPAEIIGLFGPTEDQIIEQWVPQNAETAKEDYYAFYTRNHNLAGLYTGLLPLLADLAEQGKRLAIYTGKGRRAALITLRLLGIEGFFDHIISGDDVTERKPAPEGIITITNRWGFTKSEVLMVGDAPADIIAARAAGVKVASVVWDSYAREKIPAHNPDFIFTTVEELTVHLFPAKG